MNYYSADWNGFFNWTMTYRQDSDFPFLYGHIRQLKDHTSDETELESLIERFGQEHSDLKGSKSKPVAWFVSNCNAESKREDYVTELSKHIQVVEFSSNSKYKIL